MDSISISDIMWNLNSGFSALSFKDAELILINREQLLRNEKLESEEKYAIVLKENGALKEKCDWLKNESKKDALQTRQLRDDLKTALSKIRFLETLTETACRRATDLERRDEYANKENDRLLMKIKSLEEEKAETQREIEKHLLKIGFLEKEKDDSLSAAQDLNDIFNNVKEQIVSLMNDSSLKMNSTDARFNTSYEGDVENRLISNIEEESYVQCSSSPFKLSGQNRDLSLNGLKRKRDSSERSSSRVLTTSNDNHSLLAVATNTSWQFEADMLSAIETNPLVAMEAVCALYRQHKSHLNQSPAPALWENRGFDRSHVLRGTDLAEFLLNEDPQGDVKKSPEELQLHDPKGLDDCRTIASINSRKLFEIYQKQDDPFFGPK